MPSVAYSYRSRRIAPWLALCAVLMGGAPWLVDLFRLTLRYYPVWYVTVHVAMILSGSFYFWWPVSYERLRRWRRQHYKALPNECFHCGYDLRESPGPRCPECGDPMTHRGGDDSES